MEHGRNENVKSSSASEQLEVVASGDLVGLNERLESGLGEGCQSRSRGEGQETHESGLQVLLSNRVHRLLRRRERMRFTPDTSMHRSCGQAIQRVRESRNEEELTSLVSESELDNVLCLLLLERQDLEGKLESSVPSTSDVEVLRTAIALDASADFGLIANEASLFRQSANRTSQRWKLS